MARTCRFVRSDSDKWKRREVRRERERVGDDSKFLKRRVNTLGVY